MPHRRFGGRRTAGRLNLTRSSMALTFTSPPKAWWSVRGSRSRADSRKIRDFVFVFHYTPNGKQVEAHIQIGFTVAKEPPQRKFVTVAGSSETDADSFAIPPNAPNWESPPMIANFLEDVELVWMMPHMHLRGKDMTYQVRYAHGRSQIVLNVPHYDFNWQLGYQLAEPIKLPKGTNLIA